MTVTDLVQSKWGDAVCASLSRPTVHHRVMPDPVIGKSTVEGLIVPWDSPTWVVDDLPDGGRDIYQEGFRRTAMDRQLFKAPNQTKSNAGRIMFRHMHSRGDGFGPLGIGRNFEVRDDGLWGEFHIIEDQRSTLAQLVAHGISGLSLEFHERLGGSETDDDGIVWRTDVDFRAVALEWAGAYPEAQVLAMRAELDNVDRERAEAERVAEAEREAERERVEAEAAAAVAAEAEEAAAKERRRVLAEHEAFMVAARAKQAEYNARFGS